MKDPSQQWILLQHLNLAAVADAVQAVELVDLDRK